MLCFSLSFHKEKTTPHHDWTIINVIWLCLLYTVTVQTELLISSNVWSPHWLADYWIYAFNIYSKDKRSKQMDGYFRWLNSEDIQVYLHSDQARLVCSLQSRSRYKKRPTRGFGQKFHWKYPSMFAFFLIRRTIHLSNVKRLFQAQLRR